LEALVIDMTRVSGEAREAYRTRQRHARPTELGRGARGPQNPAEAREAYGIRQRDLIPSSNDNDGFSSMIEMKMRCLCYMRGK